MDNTQKEVPVPERLRHLPMWRGLLVHFTVFVGPDGTPDFKVVHTENREKCIMDGLCHLCGSKLERPIVFIGGTTAEKNRLFVDGPMHEECALYATKVCPFLNNPRHGYSEVRPKHEKQGVAVKFDHNMATKRPPKMGLYYSNGYHVVKVRTGTSPAGRAEFGHYILSEPFIKIDWDVMPKSYSPLEALVDEGIRDGSLKAKVKENLGNGVVRVAITGKEVGQ